MAFRPLEDQFGATKAAQISALIGEIGGPGMADGPERLFAWELQRCPGAGLLLAALHVACSLLELRVRQRVLLMRGKAAGEAGHPDWPGLQTLLEEDRRRGGFKALADELTEGNVFAADGGETAKRFYDAVRIPIHHAIVARYARTRGRTAWSELAGSDLTLQDFEGAIEESAVAGIAQVVELLANHRI
jgi:hypothetical protein